MNPSDNDKPPKVGEPTIELHGVFTASEIRDVSKRLNGRFDFDTLIGFGFYGLLYLGLLTAFAWVCMKHGG
jgi:hypothetical protein